MCKIKQKITNLAIQLLIKLQLIEANQIQELASTLPMMLLCRERQLEIQQNPTLRSKTMIKNNNLKQKFKINQQQSMTQTEIMTLMARK
jgi:hypothetical protein